jgi:hypothetical protein
VGEVAMALAHVGRRQRAVHGRELMRAARFAPPISDLKYRNRGM